MDIVILNYNDGTGTAAAVRRAARASVFEHIIVVDNASEDDSMSLLRREAGDKLYVNGENEYSGIGRGSLAPLSAAGAPAPANKQNGGANGLFKNIKSAESFGKVTLIEALINGGYGYGNNLGILYAAEAFKTELVVVANPDSVFDGGLIRNMAEVFKNHPDAAAVGAVAVSGNNGNFEHFPKNENPNGGYFERSANGNPNGGDFERSANENPNGGDFERSLGEGTRGAGNAGESSSGIKAGYADLIRSGWKERGLTGSVLNSGPVTSRLFRGFLNYPPEYYIDGSKEGGAANGEDEADGDAGAGRAGSGPGGANAVKVFAVRGSLLMVKTEKFLEAGGYDENIFLYEEETVLADRLKKAGFVTYLLNETYFHSGSQSVKKSGLDAVSRQRLRNISENYYYKNYLGASAFSLAPIKLFQAVVMAETRVLSRVSRKISQASGNNEKQYIRKKDTTGRI